MTSSETRRFHLGDILSVTTECLVSPRHMDGVYDVLNWMTGDDIFTHQVPRACDECRPHLIAQHPDLAGVRVPDFSSVHLSMVKTAVETWLAEQVGRYGEYRDVTPLPAGDHTVIDAITELRMKAPHMTVIPAALPVQDEDKGACRG